MSGVPQGSVLGPLSFLIYINDFPDGINSLCKIFADCTSLFSKVYDIHKSARKRNDDLEKISYWAYQWKMQFNPDPNKQANEVIFSRKTNSNNLSQPPIKFNKIAISECPHQKPLGIVLDSKLNFSTHVDQKIKKCNRIIGLIRRLLDILPRNALHTIYKSFVIIKRINLFLQNSEWSITRLSLFIFRFPLSNKLFLKIRISLCY